MQSPLLWVDLNPCFTKKEVDLILLALTWEIPFLSPASHPERSSFTCLSHRALQQLAITFICIESPH